MRTYRVSLPFVVATLSPLNPTLRDHMHAVETADRRRAWGIARRVARAIRKHYGRVYRCQIETRR